MLNWESYLFSNTSTVSWRSSFFDCSLLFTISRIVQALFKSLRSLSIFSYEASSFLRFCKNKTIIFGQRLTQSFHTMYSCCIKIFIWMQQYNTISIENKLSTFLVCIFSVLLLNATYGSLADEPSLFSPLSWGVSDTTRSFCSKTTGKPEYAFHAFTSQGVQLKQHFK